LAPAQTDRKPAARSARATGGVGGFLGDQCVYANAGTPIEGAHSDSAPEDRSSAVARLFRERNRMLIGLLFGRLE
jgi:hypothetical protein